MLRLTRTARACPQAAAGLRRVSSRAWARAARTTGSTAASMRRACPMSR